jgi:hypothetical protein
MRYLDKKGDVRIYVKNLVVMVVPVTRGLIVLVLLRPMTLVRVKEELLIHKMIFHHNLL